MVRDFDDNEFPLAYFISFRTYGTWLHGDERGSVNRNQNKYGTPRMAPNSRLQQAERKLLKHPPVTLDGRQRPVVEKAVREVCELRGYTLVAINVRTNHVHTVVSAQMKPEPILQAFQAYATRKLRYSLINKVRSLPAERGGHIPAAAFTAYARDEDRKRALAAGYQMHIAKPISSGQLVAMIAYLAGRAA